MSEKKHLPLFSTKVIVKIPDSSKTKKYYQSYFKTKNQKFGETIKNKF